MIRRQAPIALYLVTAVFVGSLRAQDTLYVDLAEIAPDTVMVLPARYKIAILHRVLAFSYTFVVTAGSVLVPPLESISFEARGCSKLVTAMKALEAARTEDSMPARIHDINAAIATEGTSEGCDSLAVRARNLRAATTIEYSHAYNLRPGQYVTVSVTRSGGAGAARTWKKTFTTGPRGQWHVTYGFVFPILSGLAEHGEFRDHATYFMTQVDDTSFVITRERVTKVFDAVPALAFSFAPAADKTFRWNHLTAGLGADLTRPLAFLGTGVTYNSNLNVSVGLVIRKEADLLGRYSPGDTLRTSLTREQLHEDIFRLRPFFSLTLRFSGNPFKAGGGGDKDKTTPAKPEEQKAKPATQGAPSP